MKEIFNTDNIVLLNDKEQYTHKRNNIKSSIDLCFASSNFAAEIDFDVNYIDKNDHMPIILSFPIKKTNNNHTLTVTDNYNLKKADWKNYFEDTKILLDLELNTNSNLSIKTVQNVLIKAADKNIPKISYKKAFHNKWCKDKNSIQALKNYNIAHNKYKKTKLQSDLDNLIKLRDIKFQTMRDAKKAAWTEFCNKEGPQVNTTRFWKFYKKMCNKGNVFVHPDPKTKANELVQEFSDRCDPKHLSKEILDAKNTNFPKFKNFINIAKNKPSRADREYTMEEFEAALKGRGDTGPGLDKITYSMITNAHPDVKQYLLDTHNYNYENNLIRDEGKLAKIVAIPKKD